MMGGLGLCDFRPKAVMPGWASSLDKNAISKGEGGATPTQIVHLCIYYEVFPADGSKSSCSNNINTLVLIFL